MNGNQPSLLVVAALIWQGEQLLLVRQQGPDDPAPTWALPGGVVGRGEVLSQALAREVREETGLIIKEPGTLIYVAQILNEGTGHCTTSLIFEIRAWEGVLNQQDPDALILDARFMSVELALAKLAQLPWRVMREPIIAYLRGATPPGTFWGYRSGPDDKVILIESPHGWNEVP